MIDISILKMKLFFLFRNYYSIIPALGPMTDIMNDGYIQSQNEIIFFYFETITASFQYLDQWLIYWMMIDISILKIKLFFLFRNYYSIIPALWPMTDLMNDRYVHPQNEIIFFISKLLQHHSSTLINDWYNEW